MKLKQKIITTLSAGFVGLAGVVCFYNQFAVYDNVVDAKIQNQKDFITILGNSIESQVGNSFSTENQKFGPIFANVKYDALEKFNQSVDKQDFLDYETFPYFAKSNASEQIFEVQNELPKSDDCFTTLNIPEKAHKAVQENLKTLNLSIDKFWCSITDNQKFYGFKIDGLSDKQYIFVKKVTPDVLYKEMSPVQKLKQIDLAKLSTESNQEIYIVDKNLNLISSNAKKASQDFAANKADFEKAKNGSIYSFEKTNDKVYLTAINYLPTLDTYIVLQSPKGQFVKPIVTTNFLILILALAICVTLILVAFKILDKFKKDISALSNNIEVMSNSVLSSPEDMQTITSRIDVSNIQFDNLSHLAKSFSDLGRSISENVSSKVHELEQKGKKDSEEAAQTARQNLISSMHKSLMPDGRTMPNSKFLDIASFIVPSKKSPTNFYDIFRVDQDNIGIVFGDCSSSGQQAIKAINLCTSFVRKSLVQDTLLPGETVTELNKLLFNANFEDFNVSIFVMILSEFTGNFIYCVAGRKTPVLVHLHKGAAIEPRVTMQELCTDKDLIYVDSKGKFTYLDTLVFVGSGIDNATNKDKEVFSSDKLLENMQDKSDDSASDQLISLYKNTKEFTEGSESDLDICAIVVKKNANNKEFETE